MARLDDRDSRRQGFKHEQSFGIFVVGGYAQQIERTKERNLLIKIRASVIGESVGQGRFFNSSLLLHEVQLIRLAQPASDVQGDVIVGRMTRQSNECLNQAVQPFFRVRCEQDIPIEIPGWTPSLSRIRQRETVQCRSRVE